MFPEFTTPQLFLAIIEEPQQAVNAVNSNVLVCQPYLEHDQIKLAKDHTLAETIEALSHFSLIHSRGKKILTNFKG